MTTLPSGSAIPGALAGLVYVATAALPSGTTVYFGQQLPAYTAPLTLWISEITGDQVPAELGPQYRREESFAFVASLTYYEGGVTDNVALLNSLMANFVLLSRAIANNPWLSTTGANDANAAVRFAEVGNFQIEPETDTNGLTALTLNFSVRCTQRVTSLN